MIPLIDYTFFVGDINIPNTSEAPVSEDLTELIEECQQELLIGVLGLRLYEAFDTGLGEATVDPVWTDLRDGKKYDYYSERYWYRGLKLPIAHYTYYCWAKKEASQTTGVGEAISKTENASRFSPFFKMVEAWNRMVEFNVSARNFLNRNAFDYADYRTYSCNSKFFTKINSFGI